MEKIISQYRKIGLVVSVMIIFLGIAGCGSNEKELILTPQQEIDIAERLTPIGTVVLKIVEYSATYNVTINGTDCVYKTRNSDQFEVGDTNTRLNADEVFITNAIIGIQPVTSYKKKGFKTEVGKKIANNLSVLQIAGV